MARPTAKLLKSPTLADTLAALLVEATDDRTRGGLGRAYRQVEYDGRVWKIGVECDRGGENEIWLRVVDKGEPPEPEPEKGKAKGAR